MGGRSSSIKPAQESLEDEQEARHEALLWCSPPPPFFSEVDQCFSWWLNIHVRGGGEQRGDAEGDDDQGGKGNNGFPYVSRD